MRLQEQSRCSLVHRGASHGQVLAEEEPSAPDAEVVNSCKRHCHGSEGAERHLLVEHTCRFCKLQQMQYNLTTCMFDSMIRHIDIQSRQSDRAATLPQAARRTAP